MSWQAVCPGGVVTLVGNGPISETDREEINDAPCVVRFNDAKNFRDGEAFHILAFREHVNSTDAKNSTGKHLLPVHRTKTSEFQTVLPTIPVWERTTCACTCSSNPCVCDTRCGVRENEPIFPGCSDVTHGEKQFGLSSGGAVIAQLQADPFIQKVDVYGMNWSGLSSSHVDFAHPELMKTCCSKCTIHETPRRTYHQA